MFFVFMSSIRLNNFFKKTKLLKIIFGLLVFFGFIIAQQQGKMGNFKQTISTLERLNMLYPDNVEIKLYLLSVLVQVDYIYYQC